MKFIKIFSIICILIFSIYFSISRYQNSYVGNISISIAKPILTIKILESNSNITNSQKQVLFKVSNFDGNNIISDTKLKYNISIYISNLSNIKSISLYKHYDNILEPLQVIQRDSSISLKEEQTFEAKISSEDLYSLELDLSDLNCSQNLDITIDVIASQII